MKSMYLYYKLKLKKRYFVAIIISYGYSQKKNVSSLLWFFQALLRLKKGQWVKGFWSQGRKKGTEGKVFEAEAVGRGWEMFPEVPFFLPRLQNVYELPFFFQPRCLGINQIIQESFSIAPPATPVPPPLHQMVILVMLLFSLIVTMILHKLKQIQFEIHYALRPLFWQYFSWQK